MIAAKAADGFLVLKDGRRCRHRSRASAAAEAKRLAELEPGATYLIARAVGSVTIAENEK